MHIWSKCPPSRLFFRSRGGVQDQTLAEASCTRTCLFLKKNTTKKGIPMSSSAWQEHLQTFRSSHPSFTLKECMQHASKTYRSQRISSSRAKYRSQGAMTQQCSFQTGYYIAMDPTTYMKARPDQVEAITTFTTHPDYGEIGDGVARVHVGKVVFSFKKNWKSRMSRKPPFIVGLICVWDSYT